MFFLYVSFLPCSSLTLLSFLHYFLLFLSFLYSIALSLYFSLLSFSLVISLLPLSFFTLRWSLLLSHSISFSVFFLFALPYLMLFLQQSSSTSHLSFFIRWRREVGMYIRPITCFFVCTITLCAAFETDKRPKVSTVS